MAESFGPAEDLFNRRLVRDVKVKVFSYLNMEEKLMVLPRVCKNWAEIVQNDSRLWTSMEVTDDSPMDMCIAQLKRSPALKKLKVTEIPQRCDDILRAVATHCPHLEELTLDDCTAEQKKVKALVVSCTKLTSCELRSFNVDSEREPLDLLSVLSRSPHLKNLTLIDVVSSDSHLDSYVGGIDGNYPSLKELTMEGPSEEWQMHLLTTIGPQLEKLQVDHLDEEAWWVLHKYQQLQVLKIDFAIDITDKKLLYGIGSLTNLRDLKLQSAFRLTPEGVRQFLLRKEVVGRLEDLNLIAVELSEACLSLIVANCSALRTLHITYNQEICLDFFRDFISRWVTVPFRLVHVWHEDADFPQDFTSTCRHVGGPQIVFHDVDVEDPW